MSKLIPLSQRYKIINTRFWHNNNTLLCSTHGLLFSRRDAINYLVPYKLSHGPLNNLDEDRTFRVDAKGAIFIWKV